MTEEKNENEGSAKDMGLRPIVAKFGGTSMGTAKSIAQVAEIISKIPGQKVAVVSATSGTTDKLIALGEAAAINKNWEEIFNALVEKHETIIKELGIELSLKKFWDEMKNTIDEIMKERKLTPNLKDKICGFGERISSNILPVVLNKNGFKAVAVDSYDLIFTDNKFGEGNVNFEKTDKVIEDKIFSLLKEKIIPVITGFIGQSENGQYITLGRGGSDYSGAVVAGALSASELQIWTDVDGIFNADPRLVPEATALSKLSFKEAGELAYFGAKVLHPKTIKPAIAENIPVKILNTFNPSAPGTLITNEEEESIKSVTYKKNVNIVYLCSVGMLAAPGFMAKLFSVFAKYHVDVDVVATSEVSVSVTVDDGEADPLMDELSKFASVSVQKGMAIVCLVGAGIISDKKALEDLFTAVSDHEVSMVSQGSSRRNITFLVKESEAQEVVKKVFNKFFRLNNKTL